MGWPRKNEKARLYQLKGPRYLLVVESDGDTMHGYQERFKGTFMGVSLDCYERYDKAEWTVDRKKDGTLYLCYRGYKQAHTYMGTWTTLCLPEGFFCATEATDEQVIQAYMGDEHIYSQGNKRPLEDGVDLFTYKGGCPDTWGGSAKRLAWHYLPNWARQDFLRAVPNPLECRGLWRMEDYKRGYAERFCKHEQAQLFNCYGGHSKKV
jgi:hypothetical protein